MQQHVAFDVSKQSNEAVIVDAAGRCLARRQLRTDPAVMARFVGKHGENVVLVGFEAGPLSTLLCHELTAASWRARAALAARINKTDRTDALGRGPHAASCVGWGARRSVAGGLPIGETVTRGRRRTVRRPRREPRSRPTPSPTDARARRGRKKERA